MINISLVKFELLFSLLSACLDSDTRVFGPLLACCSFTPMGGWWRTRRLKWWRKEKNQWAVKPKSIQEEQTRIHQHLVATLHIKKTLNPKTPRLYPPSTQSPVTAPPPPHEVLVISVKQVGASVCARHTSTSIQVHVLSKSLPTSPSLTCQQPRGVKSIPGSPWRLRWWRCWWPLVPTVPHPNFTNPQTIGLQTGGQVMSVGRVSYDCKSTDAPAAKDDGRAYVSSEALWLSLSQRLRSPTYLSTWLDLGGGGGSGTVYGHWGVNHTFARMSVIYSLQGVTVRLIRCSHADAAEPVCGAGGGGTGKE